MTQPSIQERLRAQATSLRTKPTPLADLVPLLNQAADHIDAVEKENKACPSGDKDCDRTQCWEPCGMLGHDPAHVVVADPAVSKAVDEALGISRSFT